MERELATGCDVRWGGARAGAQVGISPAGQFLLPTGRPQWTPARARPVWLPRGLVFPGQSSFQRLRCCNRCGSPPPSSRCVFLFSLWPLCSPASSNHPRVEFWGQCWTHILEGPRASCRLPSKGRFMSISNHLLPFGADRQDLVRTPGCSGKPQSTTRG